MLVKRKVHINIAFLTLTTFIVVLVVVLTLNRVHSVRKESEIASEIVTKALEDSALRSDYLRTNNQRSRRQWVARNEQITTLLKAASDRFKDPQDKKNIDELMTDSEAIQKFFTAIVDNRKKAESDPDSAALSQRNESRLIRLMNIRLYDYVLNARALRDTAGRRLFAAIMLASWSIICLLAIVTAAAAINSWSMVRTITRRITKLARGASAIGEGNLDYRIDIKGDDEFASLAAAFNAMTVKLHGSYEQLEKEIAERKRVEEEVKHMAHHDALTGLPNRRLFIDIINGEREQANRHRRKMAVLFLDIDRFKEVNDTLGHDAGDQLLKEAASRFKSLLRKSDTIARTGGDEFNIILADIARPEDTADIARNIIASFRKPIRINGHELNITTSIGISIYPDDNEDIGELLRYADIAMYQAKELGRNGYQFYNHAMNAKSLERMRLEGMLLQSLAMGEMVIYYQPLVDIRTRQIVCAEALARWQHPEKGLLTPKDFIPAAEESGFINAIDEWSLKTVCRQMRTWLDAGNPPLCVTVNLSARRFQDAELVKKISSILKETGLSPGCLDLEITETMAMKDVERTAVRLRELSQMGIHISIDDFGTGYSSLNYLKRLPIERLKIDRSFVKDISSDPDDRTIVQAVTALAHNMKMKVLAEGVETEEQLEFLTRTGCDEMQGFLFSKPLPPEQFKDLITSGARRKCHV